MGKPVVSDPGRLPEKQRAIVVDSNGSFVISDEAPRAGVGPDQIAVRTDAVAINPVDTKMLGDFQSQGGILGNDYAGTVIAVGENITDVNIGDRICGCVPAMNKQNRAVGAFAQYNVTNQRIWLKIPSHMTTAQGSSLSVGLCTAALAIRALGLPMPSSPLEKPVKVLVHGASSATGTLTMQMLRLANIVPIATCSPKNYDLVKSFGAEECFDYNEPECSQKIKTYTKNSLGYAIDCITTVETTKLCYAAIGRAGGKYVALEPVDEHAMTRKVIMADWVLTPAIFGGPIDWPAPFERAGSEELLNFGRDLFPQLQVLLHEGKIKPHPLRVSDGGLEGVLKALDALKSGKVSGEKLVVTFP